MTNLLDALAAKEDGIARADANANTAWKEEAYAALLAVASRLATFTADDIWDELGATDGTHEPSALGGIFLRASRSGLIEKTGELRATRERRRHRDLTVWRRKYPLSASDSHP